MNSIVAAVYTARKIILYRQIIMTVVITGGIFIKYGAFTSLLWFIGLLLGVFDSFLTFRGVCKGMEKSIKESVAVMHRTMLIRMSVLLLATIVMLKLELNVIGIYIGFLLMHIFLLINLIIIANRDLNKRAVVKKGE